MEGKSVDLGGGRIIKKKKKSRSGVMHSDHKETTVTRKPHDHDRFNEATHGRLVD